MEKIKTDEDFRKFRLEVDREKVLDDAEWDEFKEEILWKGEDRKRDRRFLIRKIELQQDYDLKRLELVNRKDLTLEEKRGELEILKVDLEGKLALELKKTEGLAKIDQAKGSGRNDSAARDNAVWEKRILRSGNSSRILIWKSSASNRDIDLELEKDQGTARHEIRKLEREEKRLNSELGMSNLERMKAIKKQEKDDDLLRELEAEQTRLEYRLKEEAAAHERELAVMREERIRENERLEAMKGLNIEQLIAVSGGNQAGILGDLAQSQTLKGMSSEEIMAMKDPGALARALEERAKNSQNDELKPLYERMLEQSQASADRLAMAYREGAERAERMNREALGAMGSRQQDLVASERMAADRVERFGGKALDNMADAASGRKGPSAGDTEKEEVKVQICRNCKREVDLDRNFCPNCGEKMY